jgi:hypothetical protein
MHVQVESTWLYTDNLKEELMHLRQARRGNIKVRRLLTTKRTFNPAALASLFQKDFGGEDRPAKGI